MQKANGLRIESMDRIAEQLERIADALEKQNAGIDLQKLLVEMDGREFGRLVRAYSRATGKDSKDEER